MNNELLVTNRLLLNNWHYINEKLIPFHKDINFFTGHSGSGKSTVIDALQVLLYADTDGRGFFNKAAKDDSNRTLIEYLRGMNNVGENGEPTYLRNKNFSSTIALEFYNTQTKECQTVGIVFDVDVNSGGCERMFFWHKGSLLEHSYRYDGRTMTISQVKEYLTRSQAAEDWWMSRTNEKFRARLYDTYLGGLDDRKFPLLFKKAISFRMDTKLEEFVKEFICLEKNIHIEEMQESVVQYVRLKRKLDDTKQEIDHLQNIRTQYDTYHAIEQKIAQLQYNEQQLEVDIFQHKLSTNIQKQQSYEVDVTKVAQEVTQLEQELLALQTKQVEVRTAIKNSGYEHLVKEKDDKTELLRRMEKSKVQYDKIATSLSQWKDIQGIESFARYECTASLLEEIKTQITTARNEIQQQVQQYNQQLTSLQLELAQTNASIQELKTGKKAYPTYLIEAKTYLSAALKERCNKDVSVEILADIMDVVDDSWLNAIEGFMNNHKLSLIIPPEYVGIAMELYKDLDPKRYHKVAIIDTKQVEESKRTPLPNALSEEVITSHSYVQAYIDFLMGNVIKCTTVEELRTQRSGITKDCLLYHGYRMQHMDSKHYEQFAYIGQSASNRRLTTLEQQQRIIEEKKAPLDETMQQLNAQLSYEQLKESADYYLDLQTDCTHIHRLLQELTAIDSHINELKTRDLSKWKAEEEQLFQESNVCSTMLAQTKATQITKENEWNRLKEEQLQLTDSLDTLQAQVTVEETKVALYEEMRQSKANVKLEKLKDQTTSSIQSSQTRLQKEFESLIEVRDVYRMQYPYRGFSTMARDNDAYDSLLEKLQSDKLQEFSVKAAEQAKKATSHFKTDFIYKVRDAIKEAMQQKDDLNQILKQTDFGKEKYRFVIEKNKGEDGKFYTMFMDEHLEINPSQLSNQMADQMDLFSSKHEDKYSALINELIDIFMPPEDSTPEKLEEARRNIEKYADYRTYLSFDMEQLIDGMAPMRLSKMLTKNSGGEGQNPLYVALLASFAQVYRISLRKQGRRRLTPRLVVLDEAFSKMDGEKVASCVALIRMLGFQAIISATNDKMQNYVESVDKTFVFANPNKSFISIQSFEKTEFDELLEFH